jgi:hypothetical protein
MRPVRRIVPIALALAGVLFCVAAAISAIKGEALNPAFLVLGVVFLVIAFVVGRNSASS